MFACRTNYIAVTSQCYKQEAGRKDISIEATEDWVPDPRPLHHQTTKRTISVRVPLLARPLLRLSFPLTVARANDAVSLPY